MQVIRRFRALPPNRRRLALRTLPVVVAVRLGLTALSFSRLRSILRRLETRRRSDAGPSVDELEWAVETVSKYVPRATCLVQALALELLLERTGRDAVVQIGVAKQNGHLEAHAWVESGGRRLLDESEAVRFESLPAGWQA